MPCIIQIYLQILMTNIDLMLRFHKVLSYFINRETPEGIQGPCIDGLSACLTIVFLNKKNHISLIPKS